MKQLKELIDSDKNKASESEYQSAMIQAIELWEGLEKKENEIKRDLKKLQQQIDELNREENEIQREIDLLEMRTKFE